MIVNNETCNKGNAFKSRDEFPLAANEGKSNSYL